MSLPSIRMPGNRSACSSHSKPAQASSAMNSEEPSAAMPVAWLVDVDGTLAIRQERNPYDWRGAEADLPNTAVITAVQALAAHPDVSAILVISGRHEGARALTMRWLSSNGVPFTDLFMRSGNDNRSDDIVKEEIFRTRIEPNYQVAGIIDDRDRVVKMWRRLGLVCFQVAEGDF